MTGDLMDKGEGERLESTRRRKFWLVVGLLLGSGFIAGLIGGAVIGIQQPGTVSPLSPPLAYAAIGLVLAIFYAGTWAYFRVVDEVDLLDNLWGSTAAFYAYTTLFPAWYVLNRAGVAEAPDQEAIFIASCAAGLLAYLYRKWRAR